MMTTLAVLIGAVLWVVASISLQRRRLARLRALRKVVTDAEDMGRSTTEQFEKLFERMDKWIFNNRIEEPIRKGTMEDWLKEIAGGIRESLLFRKRGDVVYHALAKRYVTASEKWLEEFESPEAKVGRLKKEIYTVLGDFPIETKEIPSFGNFVMDECRRRAVNLDRAVLRV